MSFACLVHLGETEACLCEPRQRNLFGDWLIWSHNFAAEILSISEFKDNARPLGFVVWQGKALDETDDEGVLPLLQELDLVRDVLS